MVVLRPLAEDEIVALLERALTDRERGLGELGSTLAPTARDSHRRRAGRRAPRARTRSRPPARLATHAAVHASSTWPPPRKPRSRRRCSTTRRGEEHYNVISAFIKSLRGSDPDAAMYWMMRMLEAGEDPLFIVRRMVIFAAEDIGNADPQALAIAIAAKDAVHFVGLPEGRIPLARASPISPPRPNRTRPTRR